MPLEYQAIKKSFNKAAKNYKKNAVLQKEVLNRLLERADDEITINPSLQVQQILELGCGTGWSLSPLQEKFKSAKIMALDFSENMLAQIKSKDGVNLILSDTHDLPVEENSVDLVFSNMMLHWSNESDVFKECMRVLKPGGLFLMSCLGETSLFELKQAWSEVDPNHNHVHDFPALHSMGDLLLKTGFQQVVVNAEVITLTYKDLSSLLNDIKASGGQNVLEDRKKGLMSRQTWHQLSQSYEVYREDDRLPASYEIVYLRGKKPE